MIRTRPTSSLVSKAGPAPTEIPSLELLPQPLPSSASPVGQLVSKEARFDPSTLEDRDFNDMGTRWYKDVILVSPKDGHFTKSLGGTHLIQKDDEFGPDTEVGTIEAEEQRVRVLKDAEAALKKAVQADGAMQWIKDQREVGFVVATREVTNASYKRVRLVDVGNGNWEVIREVGGQGKDGKRRDSGLEVDTGSKRDVVGVAVKKVVVEGDSVKLGEDIGTVYWK